MGRGRWRGKKRGKRRGNGRGGEREEWFLVPLVKTEKGDCGQSKGPLGKRKEFSNSFMLVWEQKGWFRTYLMQGAKRTVLFRPHADSRLASLLCMNFQKQICMCIKSTGDFLHVFMSLSTDLKISQRLPTVVLPLQTPPRQEKSNRNFSWVRRMNWQLRLGSIAFMHPSSVKRKQFTGAPWNQIIIS